MNAIAVIQYLSLAIVIGAVIYYLIQDRPINMRFSNGEAHATLMASATAMAKCIPSTPAQSCARVESDRGPDALVVREWNDGKATLLVRERSARKVATGQLIIWSSKKKARIQDSLYDLGQVRADSFGDQVVDEFLSLAHQKLQELVSDGKAKGKRKRNAKAEAVVTTNGEVAALLPVQTPPAPAPGELAVKPRRFPSVHRGVIVEMGVMPRILEGADGKSEEKEMYGVKLRTPEGILDPVWGAHLRTVMRDAKAGVGDTVEIVKVGKKTVEEGKAPMNLYQVTKLKA